MNSPFSNKTYLKLFLAQVISLTGTGITTIALALLAWQLAKDEASEVLGTALALKMIAYVVLAPMISTIAHKIPRKFWLIFLDIIRALLVLYLPFITEIWEIYIILFLINACSAGFTPVFQATIADIIKDEQQYQKALSYSRLAYDLEQLLSPSLAALLLTIVSFSTLFVFDAVSFLISGILIVLCTIPNITKSTRPDNFLQNLRFGIAAYLKTPRLRALFAMYFTVAIASAMIITTTVVYVSDFFGKDESFTAMAMAFSGAGSMVVAIFLPKWLEKIQIREVLNIGAFLLVIGLFSASFMPSWEIFLAIWFVIGMGLSFIQVPAGSLVRISCHQSDSIALFSANFSLSHLCWLLAYPLAGYLTSWLGLSTTYLLMAIIATISSIIAWKIYPNPDYLELEHTHEEFEHEHHHIHDDHHTHSQHDHKEHNHKHKHKSIKHKHKFVIDFHHNHWPTK